MAPATAGGLRFGFGENWLAYASMVDEYRIDRARQSLRELLKVDSLVGRRFLDAGSGSGLFSLAARQLGATVHSFDYDPHSVQCTAAMKARFMAGDERWVVERGSVLDRKYLRSLGGFDIVYSWGVLHHTGDMWTALENVTASVSSGGTLCVAIYNDQGFASHMWRAVKVAYNALPPALRFAILWPAFVRLWGPTLVKGTLRGRPLAAWRQYTLERGMSPMVDTRDWVGGYPFEVATPSDVITFALSRGFVLSAFVSRTGIGCNEFVFELRHGRQSAN